MSDKFQPRQRRLIDYSKVKYPDRVKSDIRNGPADPETFVKRVQEFLEYVEYVERFYREVEDQPRGPAIWELLCQNMVQNEARELRRRMKRWIPTESPDTWGQRFETNLKPLWNDIESFHKRDDIPKPNIESARSSVTDADVSKLAGRISALDRLFEDISDNEQPDAYLHELLDAVAEGTSIEGRGPKQRVSYHLGGPVTTPRGHHGLVEKTDGTYVVTERGEAVRSVFYNLTSLWGVPLENPDSSEAADRAGDLQEIIAVAFDRD